jgi:hypothetical protein
MNTAFGRLKNKCIFFCGCTVAYEGVRLIKIQVLGLNKKKSTYKTDLIRQTISEFGGDLSLKSVDIYEARKGVLGGSFSSILSMHHSIYLSQHDIERLAKKIKRYATKNLLDQSISEDQLLRAIVGHEAAHMMEYHQYCNVMLAIAGSELLCGFVPYTAFVPYRAARMLFSAAVTIMIFYTLSRQFEYPADTVASRINSDIRDGLILCFTCLAEEEEEAFKAFEEVGTKTNVEIIMDNVFKIFKTHPTNRKRVDNILHTS